MTQGLFRWCASAFLLLVLQQPIAAAPATSNAIAALILKLGADGYEERTSAAEALWQIGPPARAALEEAARSDDPEVRISAHNILRDIDLGVRPSWPAGLRQQARRYEQLSTADKQVYMDRLIQTVEAGAIPFLLMRVAKGESADAEGAIERLLGMADPDAMWKEVMARVQKPVNPYQARLLAFACEASGSSSDIATLLACPCLEENMRAKLVDISVKQLQKDLEGGEYKRVEECAAALVESVPREARFLYLQAIAAAKGGRSEVARQLEQAALALNADTEAPHYQAGDMLREMGQPDLSRQEWLKILDIPPAGDVYDLNAHLRLASIYATSHEHAKAADSYANVVKLYRAARREHGNSYGIIGTDVDGLIKRAEAQRQQATGVCEKAQPETFDLRVKGVDEAGERQ